MKKQARLRQLLTGFKDFQTKSRKRWRLARMLSVESLETRALLTFADLHITAPGLVEGVAPDWGVEGKVVTSVEPELAMALWQLDEKDEARKWYDQSVEWMKENESTEEELLLFRQEADGQVMKKVLCRMSRQKSNQ